MLHKISVHMPLANLTAYDTVCKFQYRVRLCLLVRFVAADCNSYFLRKLVNFCMPDNSSEVERGVKFVTYNGGLSLGLLVLLAGNALCQKMRLNLLPHKRAP